MNLAKLNEAIEQKTNEPAPGVDALNNAINQANNPQPIPNASPRNNMANIQASIKTERNAQGLTQRQLAAKAGMSQGTITRAECHGWISIWCLLRIADALGKEIKLT